MELKNSVKEGDYVILANAVGKKIVHVLPGANTRYSKKKVKLDCLVGANFGSVFINKNNVLIPLTHKIEDFLGVEKILSGNDNRHLIDDSRIQTLTQEDIEEFKKDHTTSELINKLAESSTSFPQKTSFSQAKYFKRKQEKFLRAITIHPVTLRSLCEVYALKAPNKILSLRADMLGQILSHSNVRAGSRCIVVETTLGLLTGAVLQRLAGHGLLVQLHTGDQGQLHLAHLLNLPANHFRVLRQFPLHKLTLSKEEATITVEDIEGDMRKRLPVTSDQREKYEERHRKRVSTRLSISQAARDLQADLFDSLIIATKFAPSTILYETLKLLAPSRPFVVYCTSMSPLLPLCNELRNNPDYIRVELIEIWTRDYQVLPQRTHPNINMTGTSGCILTGIKINNSDLDGTKEFQKQNLMFTSSKLLNMNDRTQDYLQKLEQFPKVRTSDYQKIAKQTISHKQLESFYPTTCEEFKKLEEEDNSDYCNSGIINIIVKELKGHEFKFLLKELDTIYLIKRNISKQSGYSVEQQRLLFKGKPLKDESTLREASLVNNSKINLIIKATKSHEKEHLPGERSPFQEFGHQVEHTFDRKLNILTTTHFWEKLKTALKMVGMTDVEAEKHYDVWESRCAFFNFIHENI
ncbi:tRNA (adenine(58)-N(1))-methyltransferase non-catalytic subunit TRM6-like [Zophobas morio]|uniref:tRNA (adenine(58)-N(1))-methyltransferase non-catalytic subunit TRM6-like n=1 Tax=Zophobas morio TaxID=2755281 RepID=UPI00308316BD